MLAGLWREAPPFRVFLLVPWMLRQSPIWNSLFFVGAGSKPCDGRRAYLRPKGYSEVHLGACGTQRVATNRARQGEASIQPVHSRSMKRIEIPLYYPDCDFLSGCGLVVMLL